MFFASEHELGGVVSMTKDEAEQFGALSDSPRLPGVAARKLNRGMQAGARQKQ